MSRYLQIILVLTIETQNTISHQRKIKSNLRKIACFYRS